VSAPVEFASSVLSWVTDVRAALVDVPDGIGGTLGDRVVLDAPTAAGWPGPVVIVGSPVLIFETYCSDGPSDLAVTVWVVGDATDSAVNERLIAIVLGVCAALEASTREVSVDQARPGAWIDGNGSRPAYVIQGTGSLT